MNMDNEMKVIQWSVLVYENWNLYIAKTEKGLCYIGSPGQTFEELKAWVKKRFPAVDLTEDHDALSPYREELLAYFNGASRIFHLPVDVTGTPFQQQVWNALKQVPYGETYSYSDIAELTGRPAAVRAVGAAIGANPVLITIPCHRVIGKNGSMTGYRGGLALKEYLLQLEAKHAGVH